MYRLTDISARHYPYCILAIWAVLTIPSLGLAPLFDYDETVYAQTAVDMMHLGEWIMPTANGMPFFEKPPFTYYMINISFTLFGQNSWAARLPSALFTLATALLLFRFGRDMYTPRFGITTALIFLSMLEVALLDHAAILDPVLNFFIAASLLNYWRWITGGQQQHILWAAAMAGAAVSIKGPVGLVIPLAIIVLERLLAGKLIHCCRQFPWAKALLLFLLLATPWYAMILFTHGADFLYEFIVVQNIGRAMQPMQGHGGRWHYYIVVFVVSVLPWLSCMPWLLRQWSRSSTQKTDALIRFCLLWSSVVFLLFSLAQTKLPHYISSLYPAISLALTAAFWQHRQHMPSTRLIQRSTAMILLPIALTLLFAPLLYPEIVHWVHHPRAIAILNQHIQPGLAITSAGALLLISLLYLWRSKQTVQALMITGFVLQTTVLIPVGSFVGKLTQAPQALIARDIRKLPADIPVFSYNLNAPSISLQSRRNYQLVLDQAGDTILQSQTKPFALILRNESRNRLPWLKTKTPQVSQGGFLMYLITPSGQPS